MRFSRLFPSLRCLRFLTLLCAVTLSFAPAPRRQRRFRSHRPQNRGPRSTRRHDSAHRRSSQPPGRRPSLGSSRSSRQPVRPLPDGRCLPSRSDQSSAGLMVYSRRNLEQPRPRRRHLRHCSRRSRGSPRLSRSRNRRSLQHPPHRGPRQARRVCARRAGSAASQPRSPASGKISRSRSAKPTPPIPSN